MIFRIDKTTFSGWSEWKRYRLIQAIFRNGHFVDGDVEVRKSIVEMFENEIKVWGRCFDFSSLHKKYLTTIVAKEIVDIDQLILMASEKARLLIENAPYEWPIHKAIITSYRKDNNPELRKVFAMVYEALDKKRLFCLHAGGVGHYDSLIAFEEKEHYWGDSFAKKHVIIFDRDTDGYSEYSDNQNALFKRFCAKNHTEVTEGDVYTLDQQPYIWHVWCKRAIENYFSNQTYNRHKVQTNRLPSNRTERDYCKMSDFMDGYSKSMMAIITKGLSWVDFEREVPRKFQVVIDGARQDVSEFQLLLLKIAKII